MPDIQSSSLADPVRAEALRLAEAALPPGLGAEALLRPLLAGIPLDELVDTPPEALAAMTTSLFGLAAHRKAGQTRVRVLPAGASPHPALARMSACRWQRCIPFPHPSGTGRRT